jgi:hypothetical protein
MVSFADFLLRLVSVVSAYAAAVSLLQPQLASMACLRQHRKHVLEATKQGYEALPATRHSCLSKRNAFCWTVVARQPSCNPRFAQCSADIPTPNISNVADSLACLVSDDEASFRTEALSDFRSAVLRHSILLRVKRPARAELSWHTAQLHSALCSGVCITFKGTASPLKATHSAREFVLNASAEVHWLPSKRHTVCSGDCAQRDGTA